MSKIGWRHRSTLWHLWLVEIFGHVERPVRPSSVYLAMAPGTVTKPAKAKSSKSKSKATLLNALGYKSLLTFTILALACIAGFASRLFAVIRFESIIHEFDPWYVNLCAGVMMDRCTNGSLSLSIAGSTTEPQRTWSSMDSTISWTGLMSGHGTLLEGLLEAPSTQAWWSLLVPFITSCTHSTSQSTSGIFVFSLLQCLGRHWAAVL